jgi:hypothetical protein
MAHAVSLLMSLDPKLDTCIGLQKSKTCDIFHAVILRRHGSFDDFDYPIRKLKDSLLDDVNRHDSILYCGKQLIYDSLYRVCKQIQANYKKLNKTGSTQLMLLRKFKGKCGSDYASEIMRQYQEHTTQMTERLAFYELWQLDFCRTMDLYESKHKHIRREGKKAIRQLRKETKFRIKSSFVIKRHHALLKLNTITKQQVSKQDRLAKKIRRKFTRIKT